MAEFSSATDSGLCCCLPCRARDVEGQGGYGPLLVVLCRLAREQMFSTAKGARDDVPHIIIIVTDGDSSNRAKTKQQADLVRAQGIQVTLSAGLA